MRLAGLVRPCSMGFSQEMLRLARVPRRERTREGQPGDFLCLSAHRASIKCRDFLSGCDCCSDLDEYYRVDSCARGGVHHCDYGSFYCTHQAIPFGLLLANKQIHREAEAILYGENCFYVDNCDRIAVDCMTRLSPRAWRSITALHIAFSGRRDSEFTDCQLEHHSYGEQRCTPERLAYREWSNAFEAALRDFDRLCSIIRSALGSKSERLTLTVQSNIGQIDLARALLRCVRRLPKMRDFAIDLGTWFAAASPLARSKDYSILNDELVALCMDRRIDVQTSFFPFQRLPYELQVLVLGFAVENVRRGAAERASTPERNRCCGNCWPSDSPQTVRTCICPRLSWFRASHGVCGTSCTCTQPGALSLVSRSIRREVLRLGGDRRAVFIEHDDGSDPIYSDMIQERKEEREETIKALSERNRIEYGPRTLEFLQPDAARLGWFVD